MFELNIYDENGKILNHFTQWDMGRKITIKNALFGELSKAPIVHFANSTSQESLAVLSNFDAAKNVIVDVPNAILEHALPVIIYIYVTDNTCGKTVYTVTIPVKSKKKPSDHTYVENITYYTKEQIKQEIMGSIDLNDIIDLINGGSSL